MNKKEYLAQRKAIAEEKNIEKKEVCVMRAEEMAFKRDEQKIVAEAPKRRVDKKYDKDLDKEYLELAAAIVERSIKDYVHAGWWLNNHDKPEVAKGKKWSFYQGQVRLLAESRNFFDSDWIHMLMMGEEGSIQYLKDWCEVLIKEGKYVSDGKGNLMLKDGKPIEIDTLILNTRIFKLVNDMRTAVGLDKYDPSVMRGW